jgi:integrase/recombinase XerD
LAGSDAVSALAEAADQYLRLRRALGHDLADAGRLLPRFVAYLEAAGATTVTIQAALAWAQEPEARAGTSVWPRRMTVARGFARHLAGIDLATEVPPAGLIPARRQWRAPYIYAPTDIAALMAEARRSIRSPLRAATFETLVGLLAATGLRVGEARRLERDDVDWCEGVLVVRQSKFGKSRLVPLSGSSLEALWAYARCRDEHLVHPRASSFFLSAAGTPLIYTTICQVFRALVDGAGVGTGSPVRPRLHDLRHTFAVRTLLGWYRAGEDVEARLPWLSTYLGHREPRYTYWYLSAAPELLALAAGRLEAARAGEAR